MEKNQERIMAYQLAKEINIQDLGSISGGANSSSTCHHMTFKPSGSDIHNLDGYLDVTIDW